MKLSQNEKSLLFSSTDIPDVFFTEYLPETKGDYVKVYFYMLFLSKYNKEIKINDLSKTLALDFPTVQDAIKYWEDKGILVKKTDGYTLADIQEMEVAKLYSPKVTSSPEDAIKSAQSQYRAKAIENINSQFFQGVMSPSWYNDIDLWFNKYGFDELNNVAKIHFKNTEKVLEKINELLRDKNLSTEIELTAIKPSVHPAVTVDYGYDYMPDVVTVGGVSDNNKVFIFRSIDYFICHLFSVSFPSSLCPDL